MVGIRATGQGVARHGCNMILPRYCATGRSRCAETVDKAEMYHWSGRRDVGVQKCYFTVFGKWSFVRIRTYICEHTRTRVCVLQEVRTCRRGVLR